MKIWIQLLEKGMITHSSAEIGDEIKVGDVNVIKHRNLGVEMEDNFIKWSLQIWYHLCDLSCSLSIQMASDGYIDVDNLTEMPIMDAKEASKLYQRGSQSRSTSCTNANETSSRSHWCVSHFQRRVSTCSFSSLQSSWLALVNVKHKLAKWWWSVEVGFDIVQYLSKLSSLHIQYCTNQ